MVVEDEKIIRDGIVNVINRFGNGLKVCWENSDASAAWNCFQAEKPDIVVTDIVMRNMSGLELAQKIRGSGSDVPIVILSGYADFKYARSAIHLGVCEYMVKPLNVKKFIELLGRLKALLDSRGGNTEDAYTDDGKGSSNQAVAKVKKYVHENIGDDLSLTKLASTVNLSANYLSVLFKTETGLKYTDYVLKIRMEKAKDLLANSEFKIYEISELCGYSNVKHFISVFKKYTGTTPMQYKNK